jgi:hypothetical protein
MLSRYRKRLAVWYSRSLTPLVTSDKYSADKILISTASSIFRIAIKDPTSKLLYSPIESKRIIKLEDKGMFIVLSSYVIEITNHNFSYHLELGHEVMVKLHKMFDAKLRELVDSEEAQFKDQRSVGLLSVLDILK